MSNVEVPSYLQGYQSSSADDMATVADSVPSVSLRGKRFRLRVPGNDDLVLPFGSPLNVVILGVDPPGKVCNRRLYFQGWKEDSAEAPDCSSADGFLPDAWISAPQARSCAECPMNQWGTDVGEDGTPRKGKRCKEHKSLLVVTVDNPLGTVYALAVPPTSLKGLTAYGTSLNKAHLPAEGVITSINFTDATQVQLQFTFGGFLADAAVGAQLLQRAQSEELDNMKHPQPEALPAPAPVGSLSAPVPPQQAAQQQLPAAPAQSVPAVVVQPAPAQVVQPAPDQVVQPAPAQVVQPAPAQVVQPAPAQVAAGPQGWAGVPATPTVAAPASTGDTDSAGVVWDPTIHATSKDTGKGVLTAAGVWKKRRGRNLNKQVDPATQPAQVAQPAAALQPATQPAQVAQPSAPVQDTGDLNSIINAWSQ